MMFVSQMRNVFFVPARLNTGKPVVGYLFLTCFRCFYRACGSTVVKVKNGCYLRDSDSLNAGTLGLINIPDGLVIKPYSLVFTKTATPTSDIEYMFTFLFVFPASNILALYYPGSDV